MSLSGRSNNFSSDELAILVKCMESNPQLAHGKLGGDLSSKKLLSAAWDAVANQVNSISLASRTGYQMRAKWCDYKFRVRQKASKASSVRSGSLSDQQKLTPLELRVLSLIGPGRVKAVTDNGFDTGVVKQNVSGGITTSATESSASGAIDQMDEPVIIKQEVEFEENPTLSSELSSSESRLSAGGNDHIDMLFSSEIKKEVVPEQPADNSVISQGNENPKVNDGKCTILIPVVQLPMLGQVKERARVVQQSEEFIIPDNVAAPALSSQQKNVVKEQNITQSTPVSSNESILPDIIIDKSNECPIRITSIISKSSEKEKGKYRKESCNPTSGVPDASKSSEPKEDKFTCEILENGVVTVRNLRSLEKADNSKNWQLATPVPSASATVRTQKLRNRKRKRLEQEDNEIERQVLETQAVMASELKKMSLHLETIANTNLEILKYLKNVEKKQETVISYLSVALNLDDR